MKKYIIFIILFFILNLEAYPFPEGIALRTLKTSTAGCGSCHAFNTSTAGSFSGPDTVTAGQTVQFTLTYTGTNTGTYGVDIAAKTGILAPGNSSAYLKVLSSELVQITGLTVTSLTFDYTAPLVPGIDSLYATVDKGYLGRWNWIPGKRITVKLATGIRKENGIVTAYSLKQNYPNPFNPVTKIGFSVPQNEFVTIRIYDIQGREVSDLVNASLPAGNYSVEWNANGFPSGIYYYRIEAGEFIQTRSMILLR
ncbi:MAG: T9SS type A sorting domain-containing protein [Ignavibacteria bacterium]|nr:T9SS type A sorting domain-containing protein [Ignavibacteria bacterium]